MEGEEIGREGGGREGRREGGEEGERGGRREGRREGGEEGEREGRREGRREGGEEGGREEGEEGGTMITAGECASHAYPSLWGPGTTLVRSLPSGLCR